MKTGGDVLDVETTIWPPVQELVGARRYVLFHIGQPFLFSLLTSRWRTLRFLFPY